ncbi:hypothetical protein D3C73_1404390 [compost metagenome]
MAGEVGQDDLQVVGIFEGQAGSPSAADLAVVDEDQQPVGVVLEFGYGSQQMGSEAIGLVHVAPGVGKPYRLGRHSLPRRPQCGPDR